MKATKVINGIIGLGHIRLVYVLKYVYPSRYPNNGAVIEEAINELMIKYKDDKNLQKAYEEAKKNEAR